MPRGTRPCLLAREGSGVTMCPMALDPASQHGRALPSPHVPWRQTPPGTGGLWRHHVSHGAIPHLLARKGSGVAMCLVASDPASRHRMAPTSLRVPWHQTRLPIREGSGVAMCPTGPASRRGRSLASPHATWLSTCYGPQAKGKYSADLLTRSSPPASEVCPCFPKTPDIRLIMTSPGTRIRQRIKCVQDSHMQHMCCIKCVQDIDTAGRRQYGASLLVTHNEQTIV
jgi:hypothetical protein